MTAGSYSFENEASRRFDELNTRLERLSTRLEEHFVRFDLFEASNQLNKTARDQLDERLEKVESRQEWIVRAVGGVIISVVLGGITLVKVKNGGV